MNESVELAKSIRGKGGAGFVNGILRSILREKEQIPYPDFSENPVLHLSVVESHPLWLVRRWVEEVGLEETTRICAVNNQISTLTLRTNTLKINRKGLIEKLRERGLKPFPCSFSEEGILLKDPPPTSELPFLKEGFYIIQDEASQLVTSILDPKPGERILDACAAPGGKTTHIAQRMENGGEIYALDLTKRKLDRIEEMCRRLGIKIVKTMKGDAAKSSPHSKGNEVRSSIGRCSLLRVWNTSEKPGFKMEKKGGGYRKIEYPSVIDIEKSRSICERGRHFGLQHLYRIP